METEETIRMLESNAGTIAAFFKGVPDSRARWKPTPEKWSMLEILNHMIDEEREDFPKRLRLLLEDPNKEWPPIDPEGWVKERDYDARDLEATIENFLAERTATLEWLGGLKDPEWECAYSHPKIGEIRAGDLLASWLAHDFLHLRQLANLCAIHVSAHAKPFSTAYAMP
jgi:hypothetical protein